MAVKARIEGSAVFMPVVFTIDLSTPAENLTVLPR
jgi:hypothetical protein